MPCLTCRVPKNCAVRVSTCAVLLTQSDKICQPVPVLGASGGLIYPLSSFPRKRENPAACAKDTGFPLVRELQAVRGAEMDSDLRGKAKRGGTGTPGPAPNPARRASAGRCANAAEHDRLVVDAAAFVGQGDQAGGDVVQGCGWYGELGRELLAGDWLEDAVGAEQQ